MDISRFTPGDWEAIYSRLDEHEGGFSRETFMVWLMRQGTLRLLNGKFGKGWTLVQALDFAVQDPMASVFPGGRKAQRVEKREKVEKGDNGGSRDNGDNEKGLPTPDPEVLETRRKARMEMYLAEFEGVTPNDRASLEAMVSAELMLEHLRGLQEAELLAPAPNAPNVERLAKTIKIYEELHSTLQKSLGIDRVAREKKAKQQSAEEQVWELMRQGAEWVENEVLKVVHKCGVETGLVLMVFREHPYRVQSYCPRCQELFWVEHAPTEEDKRAMNEPAWVAEEEHEYRQHTRVSGDNQAEGDF